jgi:hypothetical protein
LWRFWYLVKFTFPFFKGYASSNWWRFQYLVVPLPPCGLPLFCCMLAKTLVLVPCFFFSPLLGCFLFTFSRPFWAFLDYIYIFFSFFKKNVWIWGVFSICDSEEQWKEGTKHHDVYTQHVLVPSEAAGMRETGCPLQGFSLLFHLYWPQVSKLRLCWESQ